MERCEECGCDGQPWSACECQPDECCQDDECPCYEGDDEDEG